MFHFFFFLELCQYKNKKIKKQSPPCCPAAVAQGDASLSGGPHPIPAGGERSPPGHDLADLCRMVRQGEGARYEFVAATPTAEKGLQELGARTERLGEWRAFQDHRPSRNTVVNGQRMLRLAAACAVVQDDVVRSMNGPVAGKDSVRSCAGPPSTRVPPRGPIRDGDREGLEKLAHHVSGRAD